MRTSSQRVPVLSCLILAGGHSRRMGQDKALLPMQDGRSLLLQTVQTAQQVTPNVAVITPWPNRYRSLLPADTQLIQEPSATAQPGCKPSAGPLSGFAYGWQQMTPSDWCLLLACDLPYLEASALHNWWTSIVALGQRSHSLGSEAKSNARFPMASLAANEKGWEPLCGFYHRSCIPSLRHQLAGQQYAFQPWLRQLAVTRYDGASARMFFNCNTPAQWQAIAPNAATSS